MKHLRCAGAPDMQVKDLGANNRICDVDRMELLGVQIDPSTPFRWRQIPAVIASL